MVNAEAVVVIAKRCCRPVEPLLVALIRGGMQIGSCSAGVLGLFFCCRLSSSSDVFGPLREFRNFEMIVRPDIHDDVDTWIEPCPSKSTISFVQDRIVPIGDDEIESLLCSRSILLNDV